MAGGYNGSSYNAEVDYDAVMVFCKNKTNTAAMKNLAEDLDKLVDYLEDLQYDFHAKQSSSSTSVLQTCYKNFSETIGKAKKDNIDPSTCSGLAKTNVYAADSYQTVYEDAYMTKEMLENSKNYNVFYF